MLINADTDIVYVWVAGVGALGQRVSKHFLSAGDARRQLHESADWLQQAGDAGAESRG